jgi:hypothetical protein
MKPLDDSEKELNSFSKKAYNFFEWLGVFALPWFGLIGAFLFPFLLVLLIYLLCSFFCLFLN